MTLLVDKECWTTRVVLEEVRKGVTAHPALNDVLAADWLEIAQLDTLDEIRHFAIWAQRRHADGIPVNPPRCRHRPHHHRPRSRETAAELGKLMIITSSEKVSRTGACWSCG